MIYIGIDPGKNGGIAVVGKLSLENYCGVSIYSEDELLNVCSLFNASHCVCYLENVHAMPKQGVSSTFNLSLIHI